jgi:hypothetical protein
MTENELLDKILAEFIYRRNNNIRSRIETSAQEVDKFYENIPNLPNSATYKEDIAAVVNNAFDEANKEFFAELDTYLQQVIAKRKNPMRFVWISLAVIFVMQLFMLFA